LIRRKGYRGDEDKERYYPHRGIKKPHFPALSPGKWSIDWLPYRGPSPPSGAEVDETH
jgi:hypothetical protein